MKRTITDLAEAAVAILFAAGVGRPMAAVRSDEIADR